MEKQTSSDNLICFFCDYFGVFLIFIVSIGLAIAIRLNWIQKPLQSSDEPVTEAVQTPIIRSSETIPTMLVTQVSANSSQMKLTDEVLELPEFVLVFIPLNWSSSRELFENQALQQAKFFVKESRIEDYFKVSIVLLDEELKGLDLGGDSLTNEIVEFGVTRMPGDRYIGLTDGDIAPDGISDVVGWTMGNGYPGVVAESGFYSVSAHELGHTFGLCDEYDYEAWLMENEELINGCPNPYPPSCSKERTNGASLFSLCAGLPTEDGRSSIMGPATDTESMGFNEPCLNGLSFAFNQLLEERQR